MRTFGGFVFCVLVVLLLGDVVEAKGLVKRLRGSVSVGSDVNTLQGILDRVEISTAQGVANIMARLRRVGHFGGNGDLWEGCGSGSTKEEAYNNCCFARSGMITVDVGFAQDVYGWWYCCRRYK